MALNSVRLADNLRALANTRRQLSGFWQDFRIAEKREDPSSGFFYFNKFSPFRTATNINAAAAYWCDGLQAFGGADGSILPLAQQGGGITLGAASDNLGVTLSMMAPPLIIDQSKKNAYFECRVKVSTIADTQFDVFVGLIDKTAPTAILPITATGTIADVNQVGFYRPETAKAGAGTGGATLNLNYKSLGVAAVNVANDVATLVADTWVKLGMRYDQQLSEFAPAKFTLSFFVDGIKVGSKVIPAAQGTDFPNNVPLGLCLTTVNAAGGSPGLLSVDWAAIGQDF